MSQTTRSALLLSLWLVCAMPKAHAADVDRIDMERHLFQGLEAVFEEDGLQPAIDFSHLREVKRQKSPPLPALAEFSEGWLIATAKDWLIKNRAAPLKPILYTRFLIEVEANVKFVITSSVLGVRGRSLKDVSYMQYVFAHFPVSNERLQPEVKVYAVNESQTLPLPKDTYDRHNGALFIGKIPGFGDIKNSVDHVVAIQSGFGPPSLGVLSAAVIAYQVIKYVVVRIPPAMAATLAMEGLLPATAVVAGGFVLAFVVKEITDPYMGPRTIYEVSERQPTAEEIEQLFRQDKIEDIDPSLQVFFCRR